MLRSILTGAATVAMCGPVGAFDFTPRTFRTFYDARLRVSGSHASDLCGSAARDYSCDYGVETKDPVASISNLEAKDDRANAASLSWAAVIPLKSHVEQLRAFIAICTPHADEARRGILVGRLLDQNLHASTSGLTRGYMLDGVRYALTTEADGTATVSADDLRMPAPADVSDGWGATDEIK